MLAAIKAAAMGSAVLIMGHSPLVTDKRERIADADQSCATRHCSIVSAACGDNLSAAVQKKHRRFHLDAPKQRYINSRACRSGAATADTSIDVRYRDDGPARDHANSRSS